MFAVQDFVVGVHFSTSLNWVSLFLFGYSGTQTSGEVDEKDARQLPDAHEYRE